MCLIGTVIRILTNNNDLYLAQRSIRPGIDIESFTTAINMNYPELEEMNATSLRVG